MKIFNKINTAPILFVALLIGCNDSFLEIKNEDTIQESEFFVSSADVTENLNAAYRALAEGNFMGGLMQNMAELMADNIDASLVNNQDWLKHYNRRTDIFTGSTRSLMHQGGRVIGRANSTLQQLDNFEFSNEERNRIQGEALFLRALAHFELVRMFAHPYGYTTDNGHYGISIHTAFQTEPVERATVGAVYERIIEDLTTAIGLLPEENGEYADVHAAKGLLALVYFQMNDFENALLYANDVIQSGLFSLDSLSGRFVLANSSESVFSLVGSSGVGTDFDAGGELRNVYRPANQARFMLSNNYFLNEAAADNDRRGKWYDGNNLLKFPEDVRIRIPLIHLTALKLIRAESIAETGGDLQTAIADLSEIRLRAGLPVVPVVSDAAEVRRIARIERRHELVGEGNRLHELKRQAVLDDEGLLIRNALWNCPGMVCQIPDNELAGNINYPPNEEGGCE